MHAAMHRDHGNVQDSRSAIPDLPESQPGGFMIGVDTTQIAHLIYPDHGSAVRDHVSGRFFSGFLAGLADVGAEATVPAGSAGSSMAPMISASTGGRPGSQPAATEPWATRTRSPWPVPSTSKPTSRSPDPVTSTSSIAPAGIPSIRLVDQMFPTTIACSISAPSRSGLPASGPGPAPAGSARRAARAP